jgi:hypothetical protein
LRCNATRCSRDAFGSIGEEQDGTHMAQTQFPNTKAAGYDIESQPIFLLTRTNAKGQKESEVLVLNAKMHVITDAPRMNNKTGRNQIDLVIESWRAEGHSRLLNSPIVMELDNAQQKSDETSDATRSTVVAKSSDADFPAQLTFNMAYTVSVSGVAYKSAGTLRGTASGAISEFPPPANARFDISGKQISVGGIDVDSLMCAC